MSISSLTLTDFRNHKESRLDDLAKMVVLTGENGAGKTNILEALSLFAPGRGLRAAPPAQMVRQDGAGGFAIAARLNDATGQTSLGTGVKPNQPSRRLVRINGQSASHGDFLNVLAISWLTPAQDRLFVDTVGTRRRYFDRMVAAVRPAHAHHCQQYESAMRERNRLLAAEEPTDPLWLDALETRMASHAEAIIAARAAMIDQLDGFLDASETGIFAKPALALARNLDASDDLITAWKSGRNRDQAAGRTLAGPHGDDLVVTMRQTGAAASQCSTGEQKAMLIALMLTHSDLVAETRANVPAIVLLDEIAAHIDARRRTALYEQLAARPAQIWMTGTDRELFSAITRDCRFFRVTDGAVEGE
ncbi:DNA replication/repair protein RecF [Alterisphingorhabdus coralli]|uniref:DNA replication and repair protein RecF n=1 Tax=Alterisphingorhabdus coralli TaxID=3071408 RepID=A0AA97F8S9_9SPHN|nr:DNA replication/repair protein RecF [Parasphingorhabdus sp. SCSIO 66989]WOE76063.1 DNA replication/repair protein RecF [Parasphingorhabdus sp. SCSIO 66989]